MSTVNTASNLTSDGFPLVSGYDSGTGTVIPVAAGTISTDTNHNSQKYAPIQTQLAASTASIGYLAPSRLATYAASIIGLVPAASATDIFTLTGAANTVCRITRLIVSATTTAATAAAIDLVLLVRSTANTAGTSTAPTVVPYDSGSAAAAGVVAAYTANPTTGTLVGNLYAQRVIQQLATYTATDFPGPGLAVWEFGNGFTQPIVLRKATEVFALNLNGVSAAAGSLFNVSLEWTESSN